MPFHVKLCNSGASFNVNIGKVYGQLLRPPRKNLFSHNQATCCEDGTTTGFDDYKGSTISASTAESHQGSYSLKVITPGNNIDEGVNIDLTRVVPSQTYTFSAWLKGSGEVYLWIAEWNDVQWVRESHSSAITITGTWTRYELSTAVGSDCTWINAFIDTTSAQAVTYYIDEMQLELGSSATTWEIPSTTSTSLTKPSTFFKILSPRKNILTINQANACEDGTITGWEAYNSATLSVESTGAYQGTYCLKIVTPGNVADEGFVSTNYIPITYERTCTFSAWLKGSGTVTMWIQSWNASPPNNEDYIFSSPITLTGTWTRYELSHAARWDNVLAKVYIDTEYYGSPQAITFYADALQLEANAPATGWDIPTATTLASLIATFIAGGINQNISASVGFTVSLIKSLSLGRTMSASIAFSVSLLKSLLLNRIMSVNATFTSSITKIATRLRTISANATFDASLSRFVTAYRSISASLASTVSLGALKSKFVTLSVSLASTVSLVKGLTLNRTLSVTESPTPSLSRLTTLYRTLSASATFTSILNAIKQAGQFYQTVSANATFAVSVLRGTYRTLSAPATFTVSISKLSTLYRSLSVNATFTVAISRITTALRTLAANATFTVGLVRGLTIYRVLSVVENAVVTLSRTLSMQRTLSVTEQPVPTLSRLSQLKRTISAVVSFVASIFTTKNPIPPEYPCVNLNCSLNPSETIDCPLNPSVTIECSTDDKEINLDCYLGCG